MPERLRRPALGLALVVVGFALVTAVALEAQEVVVLHTVAGDGAGEATRMWIAEADGALWVEAATPERAWYRSLLTRPVATLERGGAFACVRATPEPGAEGHERIRTLLRRRYGWADAWVGLLQDTSASIAVRLDACTEAELGLAPAVGR